MSDGKKVGENSSSEVVNQFRSCRDLSDIVPLYIPRALYLKPIAKINVSVNLPQLKVPGKIPIHRDYFLFICVFVFQNVYICRARLTNEIGHQGST